MVLEMKDIEDLIQPIPDSENICGEFLKYDPVYDQIKEFRREDDPRLTQGIWEIEPKKASWIDVKRTCESALKTKTKDLQIAVWWLESMLVMNGFSGLNKGIILLNELCEKYWDNIWPNIDEKTGDTTARTAPFFFLSEKISDRILMVPLSAPMDIMSNAFSLSDWVTMRHNLHIKNSSGPEASDFQKSITSTPIEFLMDIDDSIKNATENLKKLDNFLSEKCKENAPSFRIMYEYFEDIKQINTKNLNDRKKQLNIETSKRKAAKAAAEQEKIIDDDNSSEIEELDNNDVDIGKERKPTIEQAYSALNEIAVFLEKEQPQSPSSILIRIANEIGKKTFQELLEINTKNGVTLMGTISELYKALKKDPPATPSSQNLADFFDGDIKIPNKGQSF